jgi:hypothetical protein
MAEKVKADMSEAARKAWATRRQNESEGRATKQGQEKFQKGTTQKVW